MTTTMQEPMTGGVASVDEIRQHFPALERRHENRHVAYFDGPGGTQVPREVVEAMTDYLYNHNANSHWHYPSSIETDAIIASARSALADFLGAQPTEVAFGANMTTLTFHLSRALGGAWGPGDEILVTELDHHANVDPWRTLARERGVTVRTVSADVASGAIDWGDLERKLGPRTRLLAIGAASNAIGAITDVRRAADLAHAAGAQIFVDAVHYAPHGLVDVRALDCDYLACSPYKFYGPHLGVLYGRQALMECLVVPKLLPASKAAPERLETGTQSHEAMAGAAAAVDFLAGLSPGAASGSRRERLVRTFEALHHRGVDLARQLLDGLAGIPGVRVHGVTPDAPRTPTVAFTVSGVPARDVSVALARKAVFVSTGDFYATTLVGTLGLAREGWVRAGAACYTTGEEVDRLVAGVAEVARLASA